MSTPTLLPQSLLLAISNDQLDLDHVLSLSQGLDDDQLMAAITWAFKKGHYVGGAAVAKQVKLPSDTLLEQCFNAFISACEVRSWEEVQPLVELVQRERGAELGLKRAIWAYNIDVARNLFELNPITVDNFEGLMWNVAATSGNEMVRLFIEHNPPRDDYHVFIYQLSVNSDNLNLMEDDMVDFLTAHFTDDEMSAAHQYMDMACAMMNDQQIQTSRQFFAVMNARRQQMTLTQEVDDTTHSAKRTRKM